MPPSPSASSFTSSQRLLHISDLVNSKVYTQQNISSLLQLNKKSLRENILTIIHQWIKEQKFSNKLLVHDKNLIFPTNNNVQKNSSSINNNNSSSINNNNSSSINNNNATLTPINYDNIKGGWCEDIDLQYDQDKNKSVYLRQSMKIVIMVLNYLYVVVNMRNSKMEIKQNKKRDEIIAKGQVAQMKIFNSTFISRISSTHKYPNINHQQQYNHTYSHHSINLQSTAQCFTSPLPQLAPPYIISYNIYKKHKKYIFLTASHSHPSSQFFNLISLFRSHNISRLSISNHIEFSSINKLFRSHVYLQHLFTIARGFGFSSLRSKELKYLDREIPKCDINENKKYLKKIIEGIGIRDRMEDEEFVSQMRNKQPQIFNVLENTLKIYRFSFTYKQPPHPTQQQHQTPTCPLFSNLINHFHHILSSILSSLPIQTPISYHFHSLFSPQSNNITFFILFNYNFYINSSHLYLTKYQIYNTMKNICEYVNKVMYEEIREKEKNVADEVFKSSIKIYSKFNQNSYIHNASNINKSHNLNNSNNSHSNIRLFDNQNHYQEKFSQLKTSNINMMKQLSQSRSSPIKQLNTNNNNNYTNNINNININNNLSNKRSQTTTKLSCNNNNKSSWKQPSTAQKMNTSSGQIQKQFLLLQQSISARLSSYSLLPPSDLSQFLSQFLSIHQQSYTQSLSSLSLPQKTALKFISKWSNILSSQQIYLLIDKYKDNMDEILDVFMQEHNFVKMVDVGKIMKKNVEFLFKKYMNDKHSFHRVRYNYVVNYIKKLLQVYYVNNKRKSCLGKYPNISRQPRSLRQSLRQSPNKLSLKQFKNNNDNDNNNDRFRQLNIQQILHLLQTKTFSSQQYKSLLSCHLPQLFLYHPSTPFISSILSQFYLTLLSFDHHPDLVSSFIAQIFFQVVYFTSQSSSIKLNNSLYRKSRLNLKEKKFYQIVREGGFINVGYQLKNTWLKELISMEEYVDYQKLIVTNIRVKNVIGFQSVLKMIQNSHLTGNYQVMIKQIYQKSSYFDALTDNKQHQISLPFYYKQIMQMSIDSKKSVENKQQQQQLQHKEINQRTQFSEGNPLSNITLSQSGIFKQLFELNPDIKICGLSLRQQYTRKLLLIQKQQQKFTLSTYLKSILKLDIQQSWQQIILTTQLSQRLRELEIRKQMTNYDRLIVEGENNKEEINRLNYEDVQLKRDIQKVYTQMIEVYQYLALNDVVIQCRMGG